MTPKEALALYRKEVPAKLTWRGFEFEVGYEKWLLGKWVTEQQRVKALEDALRDIKAEIRNCFVACLNCGHLLDLFDSDLVDIVTAALVASKASFHSAEANVNETPASFHSAEANVSETPEPLLKNHP